jgi:hypothetical protein
MEDNQMMMTRRMEEYKKAAKEVEELFSTFASET